MYEVVATMRIARDEFGLYTGVIDYGDGSAPESFEGYNTLTGLMETAAKRIKTELEEQDQDKEARRARDS